jgi:dolichol-phosphate mannosyltransferase
MRIIAIIPSWNEEKKIGLTVKKTLSFVDKILVINDGSKDNTDNEARFNGAKVISHKTNLGAGAALKTGLEYALRKKFDVVIILAGDNQDNPSEIPILINSIKKGFDFIQGSRYLKEFNHKQPFSRKITTKLYTWFFVLATGFKVTDASNGFKAIRTSLIKDLNLLNNNMNRYELEPYMIMETIRKNYKFKEVPVTKHYDKINGYSKMNPFISWYQICKPIIKHLFRRIWKK